VGFESHMFIGGRGFKHTGMSRYSLSWQRKQGPGRE
jgi:hypothetical protein